MHFSPEPTASLSCKREFALARLRWFVERVAASKVDLSVTIRFASYSEYPLAQEIRKTVEGKDAMVSHDGREERSDNPTR